MNTKTAETGSAAGQRMRGRTGEETVPAAAKTTAENCNKTKQTEMKAKIMSPAKKESEKFSNTAKRKTKKIISKTHKMKSKTKPC